jgi:hypothetical protein
MKELFRKYKKNELNTCFEQIFTIGSYAVRIGHAWCSRKACKICSSLFQKKKLKKYIFLPQAAQKTIDQFLVSRNFRG